MKPSISCLFWISSHFSPFSLQQEKKQPGGLRAAAANKEEGERVLCPGGDTLFPSGRKLCGDEDSDGADP
jgi:hypothetical protein